jgi:hypothetical protein
MTFNADAFLSQAVEGKSSIQPLLLPEGDYGPCYIDSPITEKNFQVVKVERDGQQVDQVILRLFWIVQDEAARRVARRDKVTVRQDVWLDFEPSGALSMKEGDNIGLGRVREAVGQNDSGPWAPSHLGGAGPARIHIRHRKDKVKVDTWYQEVDRVVGM